MGIGREEQQNMLNQKHVCLIEVPPKQQRQMAGAAPAFADFHTIITAANQHSHTFALPPSYQ